MRRRRSELGLTPTQLGALVGREAATITFYELGYRTPALGAVCALADAFGCTPNDLLTRDPVSV